MNPPKSRTRPLTRPPLTASRLYVSTHKMRLEWHCVSGITMLVDLANHTGTILFPGRKPTGSWEAGRKQYFRVGDAEDACSDRQKTVRRKIACLKVKNEARDGRRAVKYEGRVAEASGSSTFVWIDPSLKSVMKWEEADGGAPLHNIKECPQAVELLKPPTMPKRSKYFRSSSPWHPQWNIRGTLPAKPGMV